MVAGKPVVAGAERPVRRAEFATVAAAAAFVAVLAVGTLWAGTDEVLARLSRIGPPAFLGLLTLSLLSYMLRAVRWHLFSRHLGLPISLGRSVLYYFAGFAMTTTPGKVGEVVRLWLLDRCHGYRYERTGALLLGDRLSDLSATLMLCLLGVSAFAGYLWATLAVAALLGAAMLLFLQPAILLRLVLLGYSWIGRGPRLFARARVLLRQTARLLGPRAYGAGLALATAAWFAESLGLYWLLTIFEADVSLRQAVFVFAFSTIAGGLSMLPGGLGGAEATMFALLLALGVEAEVAIAATMVIRVTTLWFAVGLGFVALPRALQLARLGPCAVARPVAGNLSRRRFS